MDPVIEVKHVSKSFTIDHRPLYETFRDTLAGWWRKPYQALRGRGEISHEKFWALKDVSFSVEPGERVGIIGRNGAGKSTLLKIMSQITYPTAGQIHLRGRVASLLEVGTGFHAELTGRENIYLNGSILGMKQSEIRSKFDEIVSFAEIGKFLDTPVKRYSSGMYVRLAFAVAAHLEPEILLVDEVLAVGDMAFQKKCLGKMQDISRSGRTILFVSHNLGAIKQLCSTAILLDQGVMRARGEAKDVIEQYMKTQVSDNAVYTRPAQPDVPMSIRKFEFHPDERQPSRVFSYSQDISVGIDYEIRQKIAAGMVWFNLYSLDGTLLFSSVDYDLHPELRETRQPGYYRTRFSIPKQWLNPGAYSLSVILNSSNPSVVYDRIENLQFDVIDDGATPKSVHNESARGGILQPFLDWKTTKVSDPSAHNP